MSDTSTSVDAPRRKPRGTVTHGMQIAFFALVVKPFMTFFIGLRVRGAEHLPSADPFILLANHNSHLDTVSLLSLFPFSRLRRLRPVAAADYFERNRWVSLFTRTLFNILPIERKQITSENNPLRVMQDALSAGDSLILFPEGTRAAGEGVGHFQAGIAHLLLRAPGVPVVPAYLVNMGRSLPKGTFIPVPFFCEIRLGPPRVLQGTKQEILASLEKAVRELSC